MKNILFSAILLTLSFSVFSSTNNQVTAEISKKDVLSKLSKEDLVNILVEKENDHSYAKRQHQKLFSTIGFGANYLGSENTVEAGAFLKSNTLISLKYHNLKLSNSYYEDSSKKSYAISLNLKQFTGNSFYLKPTIALVKKYYTGIKTNIFASTSTRIDASSSKIMAGVAIGNQWQYDNFTIGCDWIGLATKIKTIENTKPENTFLIDDINLNLSALNFYIGITF